MNCCKLLQLFGFLHPHPGPGCSVSIGQCLCYCRCRQGLPHIANGAKVKPTSEVMLAITQASMHTSNPHYILLYINIHIIYLLIYLQIFMSALNIYIHIYTHICTHTYLLGYLFINISTAPRLACLGGSLVHVPVRLGHHGGSLSQRENLFEFFGFLIWSL